MFSCLGTEGSKGSLFRNEWFQRFSVWELKVQSFPITKCVVAMFSCLGTEGSKGSLLRNGWFQCFPV